MNRFRRLVMPAVLLTLPWFPTTARALARTPYILLLSIAGA